MSFRAVGCEIDVNESVDNKYGVFKRNIHKARLSIDRLTKML